MGNIPVSNLFMTPSQQLQIKKAEIGLEDEMIKEHKFVNSPPGENDFAEAYGSKDLTMTDFNQ